MAASAHARTGGHKPPLANEGTVLSEALRQTRGAFGTVLVFSFGLNLLMLASPLYMLQVYDRVLNSGKVETLIMLTVMVAASLGAWAALETLRTGITVRVGAWLNHTLGPQFMSSGLRARLEGDEYGSEAFRDLNQIQNFVGTAGLTAFFDFPWTPLFVAVIWLLHPWLGMFAACAAVILLVLSVMNEFATRAPLKSANVKQIGATRFASTAIRNSDSVSAMGMGGALSKRWAAANAEALEDLMAATRRSGVISGSIKFLRMFFQSAILGLGAYLTVLGEATAGVMIAGSILLTRALAPVDQALGAWKSFTSARIAYDRLKTHAEAYPPEPRRMSMPPPKGGLVVHDLTVMNDATPILRRVSFDAKPGEAVAVIGPSAAGKSTLCKAIVGLAPPRAGTIQLDGVDISLWNPDELGPHVGYLPQDCGLFAGTIRENISRMQDAPDEMIVEAARIAHAHEMISKMPEGYETRIGEGGAGLSGGQRQRVGLARAVFGRPSLIVLDEPNANLDQTGESALAESIFDLKQTGSTLVIVGHRPSTLAQADRVLLMKDGLVQMFGPRNEIVDQMRAAQARSVGGDPEPAEREKGEGEAPGPAASRPDPQLDGSGRHLPTLLLDQRWLAKRAATGASDTPPRTNG